MQTWRQARRRMKQAVAGTIFVGILLGAGGTVFTVFAEAISHLGNPTQTVTDVAVSPVSTTSVGASQSASGSVGTGTGNPSSPSSYQPPVVEYPNTPQTQGQGGSTSSYPSNVQTGYDNQNSSQLVNDGSNSALAAAMDTGGVYVGERVQKVFGSMLKGLLNTLFINTPTN